MDILRPASDIDNSVYAYIGGGFPPPNFIKFHQQGVRMSMHQIEDLVESSVIILSESKNAEKLDLRSAFYTLYDFQRWFDTKFTHFRVMNNLLKFHFVYRFPLSAHPDYEGHMAYFKKMEKKKGDSIIFIDEFSSETQLDAYYDPMSSLLYCDAGSGLWEIWVKEERLKGADAVSPSKNSLIDIVRTVCIEAQISANEAHALYVIYMWRLYFPYIFAKSEDIDFSDLMDDASVKQIRNIAIHTKCHALEKEYNYMDGARPPTLDDFENFEIGEFFEDMLDELGVYDTAEPALNFLNWWYEPLQA